MSYSDRLVLEKARGRYRYRYRYWSSLFSGTAAAPSTISLQRLPGCQAVGDDVRGPAVITDTLLWKWCQLNALAVGDNSAPVFHRASDLHSILGQWSSKLYADCETLRCMFVVCNQSSRCAPREWNMLPQGFHKRKRNWAYLRQSTPPMYCPRGGVWEATNNSPPPPILRVGNLKRNMFNKAMGWLSLGMWPHQGVTRATPPPPCNSHALVQATVGVGTVLIWYLISIRYQM